jgi:hypothetical protein
VEDKMGAQEVLGIEKFLERASNKFVGKYRLMKDRLLNVEYEHWAAGFAYGNNHGRGHITRVLENLDHLLGPKPLANISSYELFLAMMAVLYHDIGILRKREKHEEISKILLEGDDQDAYIINKFDKEIIAAAVVSHSSSKDIEQECRRFSTEEIVGGQKARPRVVAALVRLADELDEDHRRADAILQLRLDVPAESAFFWYFCQRIPGVRPNLGAKRIDIGFVPDPQDTNRYGPVPGGKIRHFVMFCAEKFEKINQERVKMNRFLPEELRYAGLHVDVRPLTNHPTWTSSRAFVFNDTTTSLMFIQSFPELLYQPARSAMVKVLKLMQENNLDMAEREIDQLASVLSDLPIEVQMAIFYERACLYSVKAATQRCGSSDRKMSLDRAVSYLGEWFARGQRGDFDAIGRTATAEMHRMMSDGDLSLVWSERNAAAKALMPTAPWPSPGRTGGGGGGCVPLGTLIETPSGNCSVQSLRPGDEVVSLSFGKSLEQVPAKVVAIKTGRTYCCVQLGKNWRVTASQPVRTVGGWIEAAALKDGDKVMDGNGVLVVVEEVTVIEGYFEVFDLTIDEPSHNYIANRLLCHNKYRL